MDLTGIRRDVFIDRYALKDGEGKPSETSPDQMWARVARAIAEVEEPGRRAEWEERFGDALRDFRFVPGGRILAGAGTGQKVTFYNCLPPDQLVLTPDGYRPIAELDVRDAVITGRGRPRLVTQIFTREADEPLYRLTTSSGAVARLTGEHPVLARRGGTPAWLKAADLVAGDLVATLPAAGDAASGPWRVRRMEPVAAGAAVRGNVATLVRRTEERYAVLAWTQLAGVASSPYRGTVYDLEVEEDHSFVTAGVIVSNCYVIPSPEDSRRGIMDNVALMVDIMSRGGGVGVNLSSLRPRGSYVRGVNGTASGPVSWGEVYSTATGSVIQGGCFGPSVRIATDRGLVPAAELADRLERGEAIRALTHEGPRDLTWSFRNGVKPLLRVTTERGFQVEVTPDHGMGVLRDGALSTVPMRELSEGDEVLVLLGEPWAGPEVELQPLAYERSAMSTTLNEDVRFPERLGEDLAYFLGYLYADGYVHLGRKARWSAAKAVKLATPDDRPEIRDRLVRLAASLFGLGPTVEPGDGACHNVALYSRQLVEWLRLNGLLKPKTEAVRAPEAILRSPSAVQGAFFAGYFDADGCDRGRKGGYGVDSVSLGMLRDLQQMLAASGILAHISSRDRSAQGWRPLHRLTVTGAEFKERLCGFAHRSLKMRGRAGARNHGNGYPRALWRTLGIPGRYYQGLWDSTKPRISYRALSRIGARLAAAGEGGLATAVAQVLHHVPDRVASVEFVGMSAVFDFEVAGVHMLSGAGLYTSNSRRGALMLMLDDDHPDVEEFITVKKDLTRINNANLSVCVSDRFMQAVKDDADWQLTWRGEVRKTLRARDLWNLVCESAWASGEPGVVFMERYQKRSNTWYCEDIRCVNPCFVGSTRIATSRGLVTAEELYRTQESLAVAVDGRAMDEAAQVVGGARHVSTGVAFRAAVPVFKTGEDVPVFRLVTRHGYEVTATRDHRFLTPSGYVELQRLQPGDVVYLQSGEGAWSQDDRLPEVAWTEAAAVKLRARTERGRALPPERWSRELGQWLGWLVADGYSYDRGGRPRASLVFGSAEQDLLPYFRGLVEAWFGVRGTTVTRNQTTALHYEAVVARFVRALGVHPVRAVDKRIPDALWRAPRGAVVGFLQGLFTADGTVNTTEGNRSCSVRLASSSRMLLQDVQLLLLNLGIVSTLYERRAAQMTDLPGPDRQPRAYATAAQYELVIARDNKDRFARDIGFLVTAKQARLEGFLARGKRGSYRERFATTVCSVEPAGASDVFDLTEAQSHSLIVNGLISHNCGEQGLGPWGVCNLGAVNLSAFALEGDVDWEALRETVGTAIRFLDNVIDTTEYYFHENERQQRYGIRRTGLGTMGLADLLIKLRIRYGSPEAVELCERLYRFIRDEAYRTSALIAAEKGAFPAFDRERYLQAHFIQQLPEDIRQLIAEHGTRNGVLLTQAPTGTTSLVAGASSGIEPVYAFSFKRTDRTGTHIVYHELFQQWLEAHAGEPVPPYFVAADELTPEEHVQMQAVIQQFVDSSISKTVNAPNEHTVDQVKTLYTLAYDLGCKGVTYFRDGCRAGVLSRLEDDKPKAAAQTGGGTDELPLGRAVNGAWGRVRPIERPSRLQGFTERKETPVGTLFLTLNTLDDHPVELFAQIGKAGSDVSAFTEGIARLVSLALRSGVDPTEVANQLVGIGGSRSVGFGPGRVRSVPDAIGQFVREIWDELRKRQADRAKGEEGAGGGRTPSGLTGSDGGPRGRKAKKMGNGSGSGNGHGNGNGNGHGGGSGANAPSGLATEAGERAATADPLLEGNAVSFNLCPSCGLHTLAYMEGCALCFACGFSEC